MSEVEKGLPEHLMYKNRLQEHTQKWKLPLPSYRTVNQRFQHAPQFTATVLVDGSIYTFSLTFPHRKEAEQDAARCALHSIQLKLTNEPRCHFHDSKSCKSILHEYALRTNLRIPEYTTIQKEQLRPVFLSSVLFDGKTYTGEVCASKKEAEQRAASLVIQSLLASDSEVVGKVINSKRKLHNTLSMRKTSIFKQSSSLIVQKSVESSQQLVIVSETDRKLERA